MAQIQVGTVPYTLVQARGEHEEEEVGASHTVFVQQTQLNMAQIQVATVAYALVQARGEHEAVEVGAAHTVLVQRTQLNRAQIQVATVGYSDYDVFLENDEGSHVYRCKKLF